MKSVEQMGGRGWECHGHLSLLLVFSYPFPCEGKSVEGGSVASLKHYSFTLGSGSLELCPFSLQQQTWLFWAIPTSFMSMCAFSVMNVWDSSWPKELSGNVWSLWQTFSDAIVWVPLNPQGEKNLFCNSLLSSKKRCPRKQECYLLELFLVPAWA